MNNDINVLDIMDEIRKDIVANGRDKEQLSFIDQDAAMDNLSSDVEEAVDYISYNYEVPPYEVLQGNKIAVILKKVIRRLTSFLIMPIVGKQNTLNYYYYIICEEILTVKKDNDKLLKQANELEKRLDALENKVNGGK